MASLRHRSLHTISLGLLLGCNAGSGGEGSQIYAASGGTVDLGVDGAEPDGGVPSLDCPAEPLVIHDCVVAGGNEVDTYSPGAQPPLYLIGIYHTPDHVDPQTTDATVHVHGGPMILALSAYEPTHWIVTAEPDALIERIILVGKELQTATAPAGVPVESHSYEGGEVDLAAYSGYAWPPEDPRCLDDPEDPSAGSCTNRLIDEVEAWAGRDLTAFAGCYAASDFTVNGCDCPAPTCTAREALVVECGGPGGAAAADPAIAAWLAGATAEGCGEVTIAHDAPEVFPASCVGDPIATVVTFTATDADGNTATCSSTVTVLDTAPPVVTLDQTAACLWPPSHEMASVATAGVSDVCDPEAAATSVSASSDERTSTERGAGGPDKCPDAAVVDGEIRLRAERAGPSGTDNGRVYGAVNVTASDRCGNSADAALPVGTAPGCPGAVCVPHDQGAAGECPAVDDGQFDATLCN